MFLSGSNLRNRSKDKVFDKMFHTYDPAFQEWFDQQDRATQTSVINNGFVLKDGRYESKIESNWKKREEAILRTQT